jgi:hypothetical protein
MRETHYNHGSVNCINEEVGLHPVSYILHGVMAGKRCTSIREQFIQTRQITILRNCAWWWQTNAIGSLVQSHVNDGNYNCKSILPSYAQIEFDTSLLLLWLLVVLLLPILEYGLENFELIPQQPYCESNSKDSAISHHESDWWRWRGVQQKHEALFVCNRLTMVFKFPGWHEK